MTKLYLEYEEWRSGGGVCEGQEDEAWPSYEDEYIDFSPLSLHLERDTLGNKFPETLEVDFDVNRGDVVFLVIPRYYDGGTFQTTRGYWCVYGATKNANAAAELVKAIREEQTNFDDFDATIPEYRSSRYGSYLPWSGYFAGLEDVDYRPMVVV